MTEGRIGNNPGDTMTITLPGGARMVMVWCPATTSWDWRECSGGKDYFEMGSPNTEEGRNNDETLHRVALTNGFWIGKEAVTQLQWESVMGENPSFYIHKDRPVDQVSWEDCQEFIRRINISSRIHVSLPTEAQWEYACRAGTRQQGLMGRINAWGVILGDCCDDCCEWCSDWYQEDYYTKSPLHNPTGPVTGEFHVSRGNFCHPHCFRPAERIAWWDDSGLPNLGFRLVCTNWSPGAGDELKIALPSWMQRAGVTWQSFEMAWCPATISDDWRTIANGADYFLMGSPDDEEGRKIEECQHKVILTKGFWMGKYEVTNEQWECVMGNRLQDGYNIPVKGASWEDCQEFICRVNASGGKVQVSLPTEAQWEYACRAGTTTPYNFGSTLNGDKVNCIGMRPYGALNQGRHFGGPETVGSYPPNAWGLHDMHGNVLEWCRDEYIKDYYAESPMLDPICGDVGVSTPLRVCRGGSWNLGAEDCRSARRFGLGADYRRDDLGFRLVFSAVVGRE